MARQSIKINKNLQYYKFCGYGFFKNLKLYEPFLILFFLSNELSFFQIGILYSVRELTRNVLEIPAGIIADSAGRRRTMILSFAFYIISFLIFYSVSNFVFFLVAMLVYALGDAFRTGTHKAMIFDYLTLKGWANQKTYYYGHTRSYSQLGSALSSLVGGFLVFYTGNYRDIFIFTTIPYVLELILISSYPKSLDGMRARFSQERLSSNFRQVYKSFIRSFKDRAILKSIAVLSVHTGYFRSFKDYLQPVLQSLAISLPFLLFLDQQKRTAILIGSVYFVIYLLTSASARRSGSFSSRFKSLNKPLNITLLAGFVFGMLSGLFIHLGFLIIAVIFYILIFMLENLRKPMGIANIAEKSDPRILATTLSVESQVHSIVMAVLAPLIGVLADYAGLGPAIFIISAVLLLVSPAVLLRKQNG